MQAIAGAILILAGSVLVASGIIVHSAGPPALAGYFLGAFLSAIGLAVLLAPSLKRLWDTMKRLWDAIPVDEPKPKGRE